MIWNLFSSSMYSSRKVFCEWCFFWFMMYRITGLRCDPEYKNAAYPSCQENFPFTNWLSLIHFEELALTNCNCLETDIVTGNSKKMWTWSFHPSTAKRIRFITFQNSWNVFMKLIAKIFCNDVLSSLHCKNAVNIYLWIFICHDWFFCFQIYFNLWKMALYY